jgi:hypothetical protein
LYNTPDMTLNASAPRRLPNKPLPFSRFIVLALPGDGKVALQQLIFNDLPPALPNLLIDGCDTAIEDLDVGKPQKVQAGFDLVDELLGLWRCAGDGEEIFCGGDQGEFGVVDVSSGKLVETLVDLCLC